MATHVLDAFALMALFMDEPGAARVQELLTNTEAGKHEVIMSIVNLGEVLYSLERRRSAVAAEAALSMIDLSGIQIFDVDRPLALAAARLKAATGVGYLDCFPAALAQQLSAAVVTGDADFQRLEGMVDIEWLPAAADE